MTSYCLNSNLVQNLWADVVLQFIITLIANVLSIKILLCWGFLVLLVDIYGFYDLKDILLELFAHSDEPNPSSMYFSFNHNILSLSTIVPMPFLLLYISAYVTHIYIYIYIYIY